jgi:Chitobiase/beta-hexosaminidase C-terminal domain
VVWVFVSTLQKSTAIIDQTFICAAPQVLKKTVERLGRGEPSRGTGGAQQVTIGDATQGATIYYTIDGTVPTASSSSYMSAILMSASSTVQAIAVLVEQPSNVLTGVAIAPGNFSYNNIEPSQCSGTSSTDGEGIIYDTFDGDGRRFLICTRHRRSPTGTGLWGSCSQCGEEYKRIRQFDLYEECNRMRRTPYLCVVRPERGLNRLH